MEAFVSLSTKYGDELSSKLLHNAKEFILANVNKSTSSARKTQVTTDQISNSEEVSGLIKNGRVLTNADGNFGEYLGDVEEFVVSLVVHKDNNANAVNIKDFAGHFIAASYKYCDVDITSSTIYCTCLISQIRVCIRMLASKETFVSIIEQVLSKIISNEELTAFRKLNFCVIASKLSRLKGNESVWNKPYFQALVDEPLHNVTHFSKLTNDVIKKSQHISDLAFKVSGCGSLRFQGVYWPWTDDSTLETFFRNDSGCVIKRQVHTLACVDNQHNIEPPVIQSSQSIQPQPSSSEWSGVGSSSTFFVWRMVDPKTAGGTVSHYHCLTLCDTAYPPAQGWYVSSNADKPTGLLPSPQIEVISAAEASSGSDMHHLKGAPVTDDMFPLLQTLSSESDSNTYSLHLQSVVVEESAIDCSSAVTVAGRLRAARRKRLQRSIAVGNNAAIYGADTIVKRDTATLSTHSSEDLEPYLRHYTLKSTGTNNGSSSGNISTSNTCSSSPRRRELVKDFESKLHTALSFSDLCELAGSTDSADSRPPANEIAVSAGRRRSISIASGGGSFGFAELGELSVSSDIDPLSPPVSRAVSGEAVSGDPLSRANIQTPYSSDLNSSKTMSSLNAIHNHCSALEVKVQQMKLLLRLKREWLDTCGPDSLLTGQPGSGEASQNTADGGDNSIAESAGVVTSGATVYAFDSSLHAQVFHSSQQCMQSAETDRTLADFVTDSLTQHEAALTEHWSLDALVATHSTEILNSRSAAAEIEEQATQQASHLLSRTMVTSPPTAAATRLLQSVASPLSLLSPVSTPTVTPTKPSPSEGTNSSAAKDHHHQATISPAIASWFDFIKEGVATTTKALLSPPSISVTVPRHLDNNGSDGFHQPRARVPQRRSQSFAVDTSNLPDTSRMSTGDQLRSTATGFHSALQPPLTDKTDVSDVHDRVPHNASSNDDFAHSTASDNDVQSENSNAASIDTPSSAHVEKAGSGQSNESLVRTVIEAAPTSNDAAHASSNLSPPQSDCVDDYEEVLQQVIDSHVLNNEAVHAAQSCLSDLLEMTLPERFQNDFKCKISVLGVEVASARKSTHLDGNPAPEKLNYVLRVWLSDIRHTPLHGLNETAAPSGQYMTSGSTPSTELGGIDVNGEVSSVDVQSAQTVSSATTAVAVEVYCESEQPPSTAIHNSAKNADQAVASTEVSASAVTFLNESEAVDPSLPLPPSAVSPFDQFCRSVVARSRLCMEGESWSVFTVRRDLLSLGALHAELSALLQDTEIEVPVFPDPYHIGVAEDEVMRSHFNSAAEKKKLRFGTDAYLYNSRLREPFNPYRSGKVSGSSSAHSFSATKSSASTFDSPESGSHDGVLSMDDVMGSVERYLETVLALTEFVDDLVADIAARQTSPGSRSASVTTGSSDEHAERQRLMDIARRLGKLVGSFLQSTEHMDDILENFTGSEHDAHNPQNWASEALAGRSDWDIALDNRNRPCWYAHVSSGLKLRASFAVHREMPSDVDLLRVQRSRCLGCGCALVSNLFGFDCNYASCRFFGGLFCKRWCHAGESRAVPVRLLQFWDNKSYKVCSQVQHFIDHVGNKPLLNLSVSNPLLFEGVPLLRQVYRLRVQISKLVEQLIQRDCQAVKRCVASSVGESKAHLCAANEVFSLHDLLGVHSGSLLAGLQILHNGLHRALG